MSSSASAAAATAAAGSGWTDASPAIAAAAAAASSAPSPSSSPSKPLLRFSVASTANHALRPALWANGAGSTVFDVASDSASPTPAAEDALSEERLSVSGGRKGKKTAAAASTPARKKARTSKSSPSPSPSPSPTHAAASSAAAPPRLPGLGLPGVAISALAAGGGGAGKKKIRRVTAFGYPAPTVMQEPPQPAVPAASSVAEPSTAATAAASSSRTVAASASSAAPATAASSSAVAAAAPASSDPPVRSSHMRYCKRQWLSTPRGQLFTPLQLSTWITENDKQEYLDRVVAYRAAQTAVTAQGKVSTATATLSPSLLSQQPMLEKLHMQTLALSLAHPMAGFPNTRFRSGSGLEMMMHVNQQAVLAHEQMRREYKARMEAVAMAQQAIAVGAPNAPATVPALPPALPAPPVEFRVSLILHLYQSGFTLNGGPDGSNNYHPYSKSTAAFLRQIDQGEIPATLGAIMQPSGASNQSIAGVGGAPSASSVSDGSLPPVMFHWYDGCIFAELRDYRGLTATMRAPAIRKMLLRPTLESFQTDALMLAADNAPMLAQHNQVKPEPPVKIEPGVDVAAAASVAAQSAAALEEAETAHFRSCVFTAEALLLRLTRRSLCLDPSPRVCQIANMVHYNRARSFVPRLSAREARARSIELLQNVGETDEMMSLPPPPQRSIREQQAELPSDAEVLAQQQAATAAAKLTPGNGWYEHEIEVDDDGMDGAATDGATSDAPRRLRPPAPLPATASHAERQAHLELLRAYLHSKTRIPSKLLKVPVAARSAAPSAAPAAAKILSSADGADERKEAPVDSSLLLYDAAAEAARVDSEFHSHRRMVEGKGAAPDLQCLLPLSQQQARATAAAAAAASDWTGAAPVVPVHDPVAAAPVLVSPSEQSLLLLNYASFIHHHSQNLSNAALNRTLLDPAMKGGLLSGKNFAAAQGVPPAIFTEPAGANGAGYPSSQPFVSAAVASSLTYPQAPLPPPPPPVANGSMPAAASAPAASPTKRSFVHISSSFHKVAPGDRPARNPSPRPNEWTVLVYSPSQLPPTSGPKAEALAAAIAQRSNPRQIQELLVHAMPAHDARTANAGAQSESISAVWSGSYSATLRLWSAFDPTPGVSTFALGSEDAMRRFVDQFQRQAEMDYRVPMQPPITVVQALMPQFALPAGWYVDQASAQYLRVGTAPTTVAAGKAIGHAGGPAIISRGQAPPSNASYPTHAVPSQSASAPTGSAAYPPQARGSAYAATSTLPPNSMQPSRGAAAPGIAGSSAPRTSGAQTGYYAPPQQQTAGSYQPSSAPIYTQSSSGQQAQLQTHYANTGLVSTHTSAHYPSGAATGARGPTSGAPQTQQQQQFQQQQQQQRYSNAAPPQQQGSQPPTVRQGAYPPQQSGHAGYSQQYAPNNPTSSSQPRAPSNYAPAASGGYSGQAPSSSVAYAPITPGSTPSSSRGLGVSGTPSSHAPPYSYPPSHTSSPAGGGGAASASYNYASPQQQMRQVVQPNSGSAQTSNAPQSQYRGGGGSSGDALSWTDSQGHRYSAQQPQSTQPQPHQSSHAPQTNAVHNRGYSGGGGSSATTHPYSSASAGLSSPSGGYSGGGSSTGYSLPPHTPPSYSSAHTQAASNNNVQAYSTAQYNAAAAAYAASGAYQSVAGQRANAQQQQTQQTVMQSQQQQLAQQQQRMQQQQYYSKQQ